MRQVVAPTATEPGLRLGDPCVDPFALKTVTGVPTAFYNYGMAWPEEEPPLSDVLAARGGGELDVASARDAGVAWVVTDSTCESGWPQQHAADLEAVDDAAYTGDEGAGTVTLWRLRGATI